MVFLPLDSTQLPESVYNTVYKRKSPRLLIEGLFPKSVINQRPAGPAQKAVRYYKYTK